MGSYVNGFNTSAIYSFYPNVSPGYKIVERPSPSLIYYPVSRTEISSIRCWLTDQNGDAVDLRGERVTENFNKRNKKCRRSSYKCG